MKRKNKLKQYVYSDVPFSQSLFKEGDSALAPVLCWQWLNYPTEQDLRRQLDGAKSAGFGAVYILPMPQEFRPDTMATELDGYLSNKFFQRVRSALEYADSTGLRIWLYDEGGWPSGCACGKVPQLLPGRRPAKLCADENGSITIQTINGKSADIYDEVSAKLFTEITHDAYARSLGSLSNKVEAMFTDEPAGFACAMNERLKEDFYKKYGYDIEPYFGALLTPQSDDGGRKAVNDYYELLCEKVVSTLEIYRGADHAHGWLSAGHLDRDHTADSNVRKGYGNTLRALKALDIPGVDVIGGQILSSGNITDGNAIDFYPRFASSAAVQNGTALALSESFAVYGNALSGDEMRYIVNYQLVRGINLFNFMTMPSTMEKWYAYSERPYFHPDIPGFFALDSLCEEIGRECVFMASGLHAAGTALLYPYADIAAGGTRAENAIKAFKNAGNELEANGIDFDIIDSDTILESEAVNGALTAGGAVYAKIVIPDGCSVSDDVKTKLKSISGGASQFVRTAEKSFLHRTNRSENGDLYICIFNQSQQTKTAEIFVNTELPLYRCNPKTGEFGRFKNGSELTLTYGQCALILASNCEFFCKENRLPESEIKLRPLSAKETAEFILSQKGAELIPANETIPLDESGAVFPDDFCGEADFEYSFYSDEIRDCVLSFETLNYFAEVFVNGVRAGSVCTAPYCLEINKEFLRSGENRLKLKISNLAAAAYAKTNAESFFEKKYIGPYHAQTLEFEKSFTGGGFTGLCLKQ